MSDKLSSRKLSRSRERLLREQFSNNLESIGLDRALEIYISNGGRGRRSARKWNEFEDVDFKSKAFAKS